jgi:hypothetical protein
VASEGTHTRAEGGQLERVASHLPSSTKFIFLMENIFGKVIVCILIQPTSKTGNPNEKS